MALLRITLASFAAGAFALAAVDAGEVHQRVLDELERKLDEQFVGDFEAKRITGTLLWGFTAHDVEVRDSRGEVVIQVDTMHVDASALELLDGNFRFDHTRFVRPTIRIERRDDGIFGICEIFESRDDEEESKKESRPPGEVLFEMSRAKIVDGELVYRESADAADKASRTVSAKGMDAEGSFRVLSGEKLDTIIEQLDAEVAGTDVPGRHRLGIQRARFSQDSTRHAFAVASLTLGDQWQIDDFYTSHPRSSVASNSGQVELRGRASNPDGGWLAVDGRIEREDDSYELDIEAKDFEPSRWPGAPQWSWLVLDGKGTLTGRGWNYEDLDTTLRWRASDIELDGEKVDKLELVAHAADGRVRVEKLDLSAGKSSASATGHLADSGSFALDLKARIRPALARSLAKKLGPRVWTVSHLRMTAEASGKLDLDQSDPSRLVERANIDTKWTARDLVVGDTGYSAVDAQLELGLASAPPSKRARRKVAYKLRAAVDNFEYREHRAKNVNLALAGQFRPARDGAQWPIATLAARGGVEVFKYRLDDLHARRVAANVDVHGPFPVGDGMISAHLTDIRSGKTKFDSGRFKLRLLDGRKIRFKSKARHSFAPSLPIHIDIEARHGRDLKAIAIDKFRLGRPGMRWKTRKPGLVHFEDDAVRLQSLSLHRYSQKVRLDGSYGDGKKGSLSAIFRELKRAQLRSLFDFSAVTEKLPTHVPGKVIRQTKKDVIDPIGRAFDKIF